MHGWLQLLLYLGLTLVVWAGLQYWRRLHVVEDTQGRPNAMVYSLYWPLLLGWLLFVRWQSHGIWQQQGDPWLAAEQLLPWVRAASIVLMTWAGVRLSHLMSLRVKGNQRLQVSDDKVDLLNLAVRVLLLFVALLSVLQVFGYSISGLLAIGGLGGIVIGFALKDIVANFLGGVILQLDRPFAEGDWIRSPDREIEGVVEAIGWRMTCIRTFEQRPLYVPNACFNDIVVENPSRMRNRRLHELVGVRYEDAQRLPQILAAIRHLLTEHAEIDQQRIVMVNFNQFGPSALEFFIYAYTKTVDWAHYHQVKESILFAVAEIIQQQGAQIAYPTQTLHLVSPEEPQA